MYAKTFFKPRNSKMQKRLGVAIVAAMSMLLGTTVVFDTVSVITDVNAVQSVINFIDSGGDQVQTMLLLILLDDGYSLPFNDICYCSIRRVADKNFSSPCVQMGYSQPGFLIPALQPSRGRQIVHTNFYEVPESRRTKKVLKIRCDHPGFENVPKLFLSVMALSMADLLALLSHPDPNYTFKFYEQHMANHPFYVAPGGYLNLVLLERRIVQKLTDKKVDYVNTLIDLQMSHTPANSWNYSELTVAWGNNMYSHTKEVVMGSYLGIVKLFATFLLAAERLYAFAKRMLIKPH